MHLDSKETGQLLVDHVTGREPRQKGDAADAARAKLNDELAFAKKKGWVVQIPSEWEAPDDEDTLALSQEEPIIAIDLDGTLVKRQKLFNPKTIGLPIQKRIDFVKQALKDGKNICIFTARVADDKSGAIKRMIESWSRQTFGKTLEVTNEKRPNMVQIVDDRADGVEPDGDDFPELDVSVEK